MVAGWYCKFVLSDLSWDRRTNLHYQHNYFYHFFVHKISLLFSFVASACCSSCSCNCMNAISGIEQLGKDSIMSANQTKNKYHSKASGRKLWKVTLITSWRVHLFSLVLYRLVLYGQNRLHIVEVVSPLYKFVMAQKSSL